ncbi:hypothetical protein T265_04217 [Opisthorchis viverrini]|uniref:Uncharacterized protein n=1 Tax=Opisthorchis viverrini TaxID=6198 RepID=A0A074ZNQ8_OPIVI|nr:hypothetical protein T265_04217 [Opisthorchis viverrini]KER29028.1 hypothetical protein T265_04217 [Opisthorchis viverrini]
MNPRMDEFPVSHSDSATFGGQPPVIETGDDEMKIFATNENRSKLTNRSKTQKPKYVHKGPQAANRIINSRQSKVKYG